MQQFPQPLLEHTAFVHFEGHLERILCAGKGGIFF
jgi:hypothetical protein